jgi:hypothetical protein
MKHKRHAMLALAAPLLFTACASMAPPQPPSLELPRPPTDLRGVRKGDTVILTWTIPDHTTDRQKVQTLGRTRICRGVEEHLTACGTPVGEAESAPGAAKAGTKKKAEASYTDSLPTRMETDDASAQATYAIEVLNANGRGAGLSNQVRVSTIRTLPPPTDFSAKVTSKGVVLSWTSELAAAGAGQAVRYVYRVFRRPEGTEQSTLVGEAPAGERALTLTDSTFAWEKTYFYRAEMVTLATRPDKTKVEIEGADTPEVRVFADDVFPPAVPSGLQAVSSGPGQKAFVDLIWAPVTDLDLDGYNVYRREEGGTAVKINAELVKTPAYRDGSVVGGRVYIYSVSAVDLRGNESARSEEASERVP